MAHSVSEYLTLKGEDESAIVSNLLPMAGAFNIFGLPKTGKSYLALQLADAISNPAIDSFLGFPVKVHGEVLYLQIDTPRNLWIDRVVELQGKGLTFENVYFADRQDCPDVTFDVCNADHHKWLVGQCQERPYLTVVIDTLRECFDDDENDASVMKKVIGKLVAATAPAAMVLLSHSRKPSREAPSGLMQNGRGSSYVSGRMDALMEVGGGRLTTQSRTSGEVMIPVMQAGDCGMFSLSAPLTYEAEKVLHENPEASLREQAKLLQDRLGGGKNTEACRSLLRRLREKA